ncbi:unnamed protein product [Didymodactylos carnosus]|uniref:Uncharacterized protein n=1 Tax=Didymodactylos carnosus TaxID=1234261 RepID=A0A8S2FWQ8_9BILA|nr:unnamed protein product [Didymodactylos carnosus]CAF4373429.1 unnamed protein product [Didymodactylos carnosus]
MSSSALQNTERGARYGSTYLSAIRSRTATFKSRPIFTFESVCTDHSTYPESASPEQATSKELFTYDNQQLRPELRQSTTHTSAIASVVSTFDSAQHERVSYHPSLSESESDKVQSTRPIQHTEMSYLRDSESGSLEQPKLRELQHLSGIGPRVTANQYTNINEQSFQLNLLSGKCKYTINDYSITGRK